MREDQPILGTKNSDGARPLFRDGCVWKQCNDQCLETKRCDGARPLFCDQSVYNVALLRHRLWPPREAPRDVATSAASTVGPLRTSSHNGRRQREAATAAAGDVFHVRLWLRVTLHTTMHLVPLGHCDSPPVRLRVYKHTHLPTHTHTHRARHKYMLTHMCTLSVPQRKCVY